MAADRTFPEGGFTSLRQKAIAQQGKPLGVTELVRTEAIGSSVVRFVFLEKHERSGYIWKLTLYRTGSQWKWLNLNLCEWGNEFETAR